MILLYVIDGVPVAAGGINGGRNQLQSIKITLNRVSVLKDARQRLFTDPCSNGVPLLQLKRKVEKTQVTVVTLQVSEITKVDALSATNLKILLMQRYCSSKAFIRNSYYKLAR
jgi:iron complex outermembrane receptor protein